ncbi:unnamed protein product [Lactuca saligna]|uniref:Uncharacterized protein n=1 Tax=Lactuca saligna TaxID=75948 RepID=A0AA35VAB8_LACSI|nr:unnamed protein product [Lactuca saligna]
MHTTKSHMRRVFIMNDCNELMQKYLGPLGNVVDSYDLPVNNSHERLHRNKILQVIKKKHIEMFSKIAENKKDGEAVVISNERNSASGRTSHSRFMEEGSCSEVHLLGWGIAKALVMFKKDDGSSFHYLPPCLIIHENGKTDEAVKLIMGAMEQVGGIYMVIGVVVADHGKTDGKKKRPPERIWVSCINSIHLEEKVVLLG